MAPVGELARGWLHPGWSWTVRYARVVALGFSAGSLLLGIGISAAVALAPGGLSQGQEHRLQWLIAVASGLALVVYAASETARRGRDRMLTRNGIAYIVTERARDWADDEPDDFYGQVARRFARVVQVPGPRLVDREPWDWPLDQGAREWDAKASGLVRSFRVLNLAGKNPGTPPGIFVTAWWPVAMAFGQRVTAADRALELRVWQRPSRGGRAGKIEPRIWSQRPHTFQGLAGPVSAGLALRELLWEAVVAVTRPDGAASVASGEPVSLLLVRFSRAPWGPLPVAGSKPPDAGAPRLLLHDAVGVVPAKNPVCVHELRCTPPGTQPAFGWGDYPFLAAEALAWIQRKATELDGHVLLLATVVPNEVALGIGIMAGRDSALAWPRHLWPAMYRKPAGTFVVPSLDLGTAAVTE